MRRLNHDPAITADYLEWDYDTTEEWQAWYKSRKAEERDGETQPLR
jgi:phage anti-repressor protein